MSITGVSPVGLEPILGVMPLTEPTNTIPARPARQLPQQEPPPEPNRASTPYNTYDIYRSADGDSAQLVYPRTVGGPNPFAQPFGATEQPFGATEQPFGTAGQPSPFSQEEDLPAWQTVLADLLGKTGQKDSEPKGPLDADPKKLIPEMPGSGLLDELKPEGECQTCANRKYVDGSDDPSVSYQTPTNISAGQSIAAVAMHEQEHVRNEQANAAKDGRRVINQSVTIHYDNCPECGRTYASGGTTRTTSVGKKEVDTGPDFEPTPLGGGGAGKGAEDE